MPKQRRAIHYTNWMIPSLYTVAAIFLGMALPRVETYFFPNSTFSLSVDSSMTIGSAVATGTIALTGIVFSLAFVMIQFSTSAYSPRLTSWMARDPVMSNALGVFIATFVYALLAIAWIDRGHTARVPLVTTLMMFVLLLASMAMFIALIGRMGILVVNRTLRFVGDRGRSAIAFLYAPLETTGPSVPAGDIRTQRPTQTLVHHEPPQTVQAVHIDRLVKLAAAYNAVIEVVAPVGDVVVEGTPVAHVYGSGRSIDEQELWEGIGVGEERTFDQDPKYAIRLLVDIGIKALSPALNDPTTAVEVLDHIGDLLVRLGGSRIEIGAFRDARGVLRLIVPFPSWEDFLLLSFEEIRHYGADSVQVMRRMLALVSDLMAILPVERRPALLYWQERLHSGISRSFDERDDKDAAAVADRQGLALTRRQSAAGL
jgi:uncharacterized membrane protein